MIEIARCLVRRVVATHPDNKVAKRILAFLSSTEDINKLDWVYLFNGDAPMDNTADNDGSPQLFDRGNHKDFRIQSLSLRGFRKYPYKENFTYNIDFCKSDKQDVCSCYLIGNNGTGKTSIFSALQEICSDSVTAAEIRDIGKKLYMPHAGVNINNIDATISTMDGSIDFQNPETSLMYNYRKFLRPFFCSEYDITVMAKTKDITEYIIQQTGYKKSYDLIQLLDQIYTECVDNAKVISDRLNKNGESNKILPQDYAMLKTLMNDSFNSLVLLKLTQNNEGRAKDLHHLANLMRNDIRYKKIRPTSKNIASDLDKLSEELSSIIAKIEKERQKMTSLDVCPPYLNEQYSSFINHCGEIIKTIHNWFNMEEARVTDRREQFMLIEELTNSLSESNLRIIRFLYAYILDELANSISKKHSTQEYIQYLFSEIKKWTDSVETKNPRLTEEKKLEMIESNKDSLKQCIDELRTLFHLCVHKALDNAGVFCRQILEEFNMEGENLKIEFDKEKTQLRIEYEIEKKRLEPALLLNSFRFRLYTLCVKASMAFSVMQIMNLSFPLVFDDVFYSSDFVNREKVNEFFEKIFSIYHEQFTDEALPLQILFFTHDEIVLESAIKGTLASHHNDVYKYGRIFNYQELESEKDEYGKCPLAIIYGSNE